MTSSDLSSRTSNDDLEALRIAAARAGLDPQAVVEPRDADIVARGMRFHYLDWGSPEKTNLVFLHGGALTAHTYDVVCLALRGDYHCISIDQRGHGDSEWSPVTDYRPETQAEDVLAVLDAVGIERCVLIGMSMGGINALHFAAGHGDRLLGLVIIDTGPEITPEGARPIRDFITRSSGERDSVEDYIEDAMRLNPRRDRQLLRRSLRHNLRQTPNGKWVWKWDPRPRLSPAQSAEQIAARREHLWQLVGKIACETLVVRGADSEIFSEENAAKLVDRLQHGRLARVESAGHNVQGDNPAGLVRELGPFLREVASRRRDE